MGEIHRDRGFFHEVPCPRVITRGITALAGYYGQNLQHDPPHGPIMLMPVQLLCHIGTRLLPLAQRPKATGPTQPETRGIPAHGVDKIV